MVVSSFVFFLFLKFHVSSSTEKKYLECMLTLPAQSRNIYQVEPLAIMDIIWLKQNQESPEIVGKTCTSVIDLQSPFWDKLRIEV